MKFLFAAAAAAALTVLPIAAQAQQAQVTPGAYGTLGYADNHGGGVDLGAIQGRLGWRYNNWLGAEGEVSAGLKSDHETIAGVRVRTKLQNQAAVYGVAFAPIATNTELLARIGYGASNIKTSVPGASSSDTDNSWNFGVGAQHYFDGMNGIRADYTRQEFTGHSGHANVWAVAYTRRF